MITEKYVSFETAKLLKEKGFDWECFFCWDNVTETNRISSLMVCSNKELVEHYYAMPTLQMAMKWLRVEKNWFVQIQIQNDGTYIGYIYRTDGFPYVGWDKRRVKETSEEACEAAIKYCLENLI